MALEKLGTSDRISAELFSLDSGGWLILIQGPSFALYFKPAAGSDIAAEACKHRGREYRAGDLHGTPVVFVPLEERVLIRLVPDVEDEGTLTLFLTEEETKSFYRALEAMDKDGV